MKKITKLLLAFTLGLSVAAVSSVASAYWYGGYNSGYYGGSGYYGHQYKYKYYYRCKWIPGHWAYGYWYPARKVCWRR